MKITEIQQVGPHEAHDTRMSNGRKTAQEMDETRQNDSAYMYLCNLEAAKKWMEACLREKLPPTTELEENLRNGVYLAKLGNFMAPEVLPFHKIYDPDQRRYLVAGLQFRHTDNIINFLKCLKSMQLPLLFQPETTDIYDKKNMPRLVYCIHALSTHLFKLGKAPLIQDLYGKVKFTNEQIDAMERELINKGIQMPAFQKIGGLLTNSNKGDTAALHQAVSDINKAIALKNQETLLNTLEKPNAQIQFLKPEYTELYLCSLYDAKISKEESAMNRSLNDSYVPDENDKILTHAEIQGHITFINIQSALQHLTEQMNQTNPEIIPILSDPSLQLKNVNSKNYKFYKSELKLLIASNEWEERITESCNYWQTKLQKSIDNANGKAQKMSLRKKAIDNLNCNLLSCNENDFYNTLMDPNLGIDHLVDDFAVPLYFEEMKIDRIETKANLTYEDIVACLNVLTAIGNVNKAVDMNNPNMVYDALRHPDTHIQNLEVEHKVKYTQALRAVREEKRLVENVCPLLTYIDIQDCIDSVNEQCLEDTKIITKLELLTQIVKRNQKDKMFSILEQIGKIINASFEKKNVMLYMILLKKNLVQKHADGSGLWLEDILEMIESAKMEHDHVESVASFMYDINEGLKRKDVLLVTENIEMFFKRIDKTNQVKAYEKLLELKKYKEEKYSCPIIEYMTPLNNIVYLNPITAGFEWEKPKNIGKPSTITLDDVREAVMNIRIADTKVHFDRSLINFQAHARGCLTRRKLLRKIKAIISIQIWWRKVLKTRTFTKTLHEDTTRDYSSGIGSKSSDSLSYYRSHEDDIIKIQALWRGRLARRNFHSLLRMDNPPYYVVRSFACKLEFSSKDYDKDLLLEQLKADVVQSIKHNQNLAKQLNDMDLKIGLLIQNRITLQDVVRHGKDLENLTLTKGFEKKDYHSNKYSFENEIYSTQKGLKSLTKEGRQMLEGYQHLFYELQTNPNYLSKLLILLPQNKSHKFIHNVILQLFNFGCNSREEYLLLKLLGNALREEIRSKYTKPSEVVTASPLVLKVAIDYARKLGQRALRDIIGPTIQKMIDNTNLIIESNPTDIFKSWRNTLEMESGKSADLPLRVTEHEALRFKVVRERLKRGIEVLREITDELLTCIIASRDSIPYGVCYMAKILNETLQEKFPHVAHKEIIKIVGNLIYFQFLNPAIVTPDAFDIIALPINKSLSNEQRRNLATVAKILHFAASKKGFAEEHLLRINPFIIDCHIKFKNFFMDCCDIEDLDEHFNMSEYSEETLIQKPVITISVQEMIDTHTLLVEHQDLIAPDPQDQMHELLDDIGGVPTVPKLLGKSQPKLDSNFLHLGKTEITLVLSKKYEEHRTDETSMKKMFITTKELLVSVLPYLPGDTLIEALEGGLTPIPKRSSQQNRLDLNTKSETLEQCKRQIRASLKKLELYGLVSRDNGYQAIVTAVAKDLANKSRYHILREKELKTLRNTKQRLDEKTKYYEEQVQFYSEYIKKCLENLSAGKKSLHDVKTGNKSGLRRLKSKSTLKFTATKLKEKGIIVKFDNLPDGHMKNVVFEISPAERNGVFAVCGKFMGVSMEKVEVDVQNLLELQYEGCHIITMFGEVQVNVNLLLHLINCKFYGKK
ncbi:hypothetical protein TKK_0012795 [Trichogramma kaykai]|uniref:Ras GTPase-activating-like protein IQGAP1 n=1 Tax=Trichogramma kaykai TaxID=54128 RepID=A0ABD2WLC4_9HYME